MKTLLNDEQRLSVPRSIFGKHFDARIEPDIYAMAQRLSPDYQVGRWNFYLTERCAFFMAPAIPLQCVAGFVANVCAVLPGKSVWSSRFGF